MKYPTYSLGKFIFIFLVFLPSLCSAQLWPHIKTFGFDYGFPRTIENLQFIASHHDVVIGSGDWQSKKLTEEQYDILKKTNPNIIIIPYASIHVFTFQIAEDFILSKTLESGYKEEDLYLHYYCDNVVKTRVPVIKTSETGTPTDRVCDSEGNLIKDGEKSYYFIAWGFVDEEAGEVIEEGKKASAKSLTEARVFQYWNADFEPHVNYLSTIWKDAYKEYILDAMTSGVGKYADGVFTDNYPVAFDKEGRLPNMHQIRELRAAGYSSEDKAARVYYASQIAEYIGGDLKDYLKAATGKKDIHIIPNFALISLTYGSYVDELAKQIDPNKLTEGAIEYTTEPAMNYYVINSYFKTHYEYMSDGVMRYFNNWDTKWYHYGDIPPIGGKQYLIGSMYLFNNPESYSSLHYGTASAYGPGIFPNIGEAKGGKYADSHWDIMLEFDIGTPVVRVEKDFWDMPNTDRMYLIDYEAAGPYDPTLSRNEPRGRFVLAREYTKALAVVRFEFSNNNKLSELGTEPLTYQLNGEYKRLLEDNSFGPVITEITLGLSEGAILIKKEFANISGMEDIEFDQEKTTPLK